ncbi:thiamine-phosphate kinase [Aliarcobacter cryaerophilus]|uniref:thiamine-phosphate kinase n=1 Tax=Aliarcobacter cryaerophilus TaxID=28198 RepID=UPI0021B2EF18|nr:thiamine-phosphate kinase [Aliarcobacter cryaerophilus]MCT7523189.1 thiamine-phosphate kinase [Aliarcobacter cryaerophilus]
MDNKKLYELSEKILVKEIIKLLEVDEMLLDGFGHDSAFINTTIHEDEILLMNTDRSGINTAYTLGLANGECVGDFGVSHAISDIIASGGQPLAISIALLLPDNLTLGFVKEVMIGAQKAAKKYGAFLAAGDTKKNNKFAMVVTATGKAQKTERLTRANAKKGDFLIVTGHLGTMLAGKIAFKQNLELSTQAINLFKKALIFQNPPYTLSTKLSKSKLTNACTDISDGLSSSIYNLCNASNLGAIIDESKIPIHKETLKIATTLNIRPIQLTLTGGDWQFLYSVPEENIKKIKEIAQMANFPISIIGKLIEENTIVIKTLENKYKHLLRLENDKFSKHSGESFLTLLEKRIPLFGKDINSNLKNKLMEIQYENY